MKQTTHASMGYTKQEVKSYLYCAENHGYEFHNFPVTGVTAGFRPINGSDTEWGRMALAYRAPDENKNRPNIGKMIVLNRLDSGECTVIRYSDFETMLQILEEQELDATPVSYTDSKNPPPAAWPFPTGVR